MLFFPVLLLETSSRYNPDIRVVREWGGLKLLVNGSRQSGRYIRMLWKRAFHKFRLERLDDIQSILVLGIGGGTVIELLATRYPGASITAVDIDSTMIAMAKEYFGIGAIPNVRLVRAEAKAFIERAKKDAYDLVIVDLFIGREIPRFVESAQFYRSIKQTLKPDGVLILNYLRERAYETKSETVFLRLKTMFRDVGDFPIANNRFFYAT